MKTQNTNLLMELSENRLQELVKTVEETVAVNIDQSTVKTFSAADLWKIQNMRKVRTIRKFAA